MSARATAETALTWCNEMRVERGMEPLDHLPKGRLTDPASCPCGRATGLWVEEHEYSETRDLWFTLNPEHRHPLPQDVQLFVHHFDNRVFPWLIESSADS